MMRNPEEIRQSYMAFFGVQNLPSIPNYEKGMKMSVDMLRNRRDTEVVVLWYRDVIDNPKKEFQKLSDAGWPIDVDKCVAIVDPKLCRYRIENLTVGVL